MTALPADHPLVTPPRNGVLLVNLGTPDAPTPSAVRRYLKQFLSDRRVVEIPPILWQPILRGIILNTRPKKSARAYAEVWSEDGSPLAAITKRQALALQARMGDAAMVRYAMRYGQPAIGATLDEMITAGCQRILIAPLYPQYCGATTATVTDAVGDHLASLRWQPALRSLPPYHDHHAYIAALKSSVEAGLATLDFVPDVLLASFHGMPERTLLLGDPYHCQCVKTARLLAEAMGRDIAVSFQSRFGNAKWLDPATDATIERLAGGGTKRLAVFAPGFSADCLETLEELAMQGRDSFVEHGGEQFAYLPCLNDSAPGMDMLEALVRSELSGWLT
jgi:protoporphyrin/coproporphyrin ferrochelatase